LHYDEATFTHAWNKQAAICKATPNIDPLCASL